MPVTDATQVPLSRRLRVIAGLIAALSGVAGLAAVFLTGNELGSAALLVLTVYFAVTVSLGRFPKLTLAGSQIDPGELEQTRQASDAAKLDAAEVKEGLKDTRARLAALEAAIGTEQRALATAPTPSVGHRLDDRLLALAREYDEVRWTMPSGGERTIRMAGIVDRMIAVCRQIDVPDVEVLLASEDPGLRLVGVACLSARPDPTRIESLVRVATSDQPFNEYWALVTLRKALRGHCDRLDARLRLSLQARLDELPPRSDRALEIHRILAECP
jgi:hypothetical protein